jgi:hypothetical protein
MSELLSRINIQSKLKYAAIRFEPRGELYAYKTMLDNLEINDLVVVHCKSGFKVVHFYAYIDKDSRATDWIMHKVDQEEYKRLVEGDYE